MINIGQEGIESGVTGNAIINSGNFVNNDSINIDEVSQDAVQHQNGTFLNTGAISIGNGVEMLIGGHGINATQGLTNQGTITIDNTTAEAIQLSSGSSSTNEGTFNIGLSSTSSSIGILVENNTDLTNLSTGVINIKNYATGLRTDATGGTISNAGSISFENNSNFSIEGNNGFGNTGTISGEGNISLSNNQIGGNISPGFSPGDLSFSTDVDFLNGSTLVIDVDGANAGSFDRILGGGNIDFSQMVLSVDINYSPSDNDRIVFLDAGSINGPFLSVNPGLPSGWFVDYSVAGEVALQFDIALSVNLVRFEVLQSASDVLLEWQTASETNNSGFDIEHSTNGIDWEIIGFIEGLGNSAQPFSYSFLHKNPLRGLNYYRLRQVDLDGQFEYSPIRSLDFKDSARQWTISPNPVTHFFNIILSAPFDYAQLKVNDSMGRIVLEQNWVGPKGISQIDISGWESGLYWIQVRIDGQEHVKRLIVTQD